MAEARYFQTLNRMPGENARFNVRGRCYEEWLLSIQVAILAGHDVHFCGTPITTASDFILCVDSAEERARFAARLEAEAVRLGARIIRSWPRVFEQAYATLHRTLQREDPKTGEHEVAVRRALWIISEDEAPSVQRFERTWCAANWPAHHAGDGVVPCICGGPVAASWPEISPATVIFARLARHETAERLLRFGCRHDPALVRRQTVFLEGEE